MGHTQCGSYFNFIGQSAPTNRFEFYFFNLFGALFLELGIYSTNNNRYSSNIFFPAFKG
jgi:hypothetical protein